MEQSVPHIIRVRQNTELASLISEILDSGAETTYLMVDDGAVLAQHVLNLRLLKREAESAGKRVVVVSENQRIQRLASQASLEVHQNTRIALALAQQPADAGAPRGMADIVLPGDEDEEEGAPEDEDEEALDEEMPAEEDAFDDERASVQPQAPAKPAAFPREQVVVRNRYEEAPARQGAPARRRSPFALLSPFFGVVGVIAALPMRLVARKPRRALLVGGVGAAGALMLFVAFWVLPSATLKITPATAEERLSFDLAADSNVSSPSPQRGIVPAQILDEREEKRFTFKASGQEDVRTYATGRLTVYNEYSSEQQTLVASTRFLSADGKLFRTTETVIVPGAKIENGKIVGSSTTVAVQADSPGESFNIGPTTFSIPGFQGTDKFLAFYGKSEARMEGGFEGVRAVATQEDIDKARTQVEEELLPVVEKRLREQVPNDLVLLDVTFERRLAEMNVDVEAGSAADEFSVRAVAQARAFLLREDQVREFVVHNIEQSGEYDRGKYEFGGKQELSYEARETNFTDGIARLSLQVTQSFRRVVDVETLVSELAGKEDVEVRRILAQHQAEQSFERVQVRFWPFWVHSVPNNPDDITVELSYPDE